MHTRPTSDGASPWLLLCCMAITFAAGPSVAAAAPAPPAALVFAGSGANLAITRLLAQAFVRTYPDVAIEVPASIGSTGGIQAAADGSVAVGLVSRPLKEQEKALGLALRPYARSAIVFGAHPTVVDDGLTFDELLGIYRGTKTRWRDGREIVVLTRQPTDSGIEALELKIPGFREVYAESQKAKRWITLYTDQDMNQTLVKTPYAIGLLDLGIIQSEHLTVKPLRINGVAPTEQSVLNGTYPLVKRLAFVYREAMLAPTAKAFLDFVRSRAAQQILRTHNYQPAE
ncbi:MAG: substrate-binding domain-containing protein [candidate division NC10 bacterium]|nr:substrate-binding domain-containing protein [candidate division NC10 bacterium]